MKILIVFGLALVGCGSSTGPADLSGTADGAIDASSGSTSLHDMSGAFDGQRDGAFGLCTTIACAAQPCTPGCVFAAASQASCPAMVAANEVSACTDFCGLIAGGNHGSILGCWYYDASKPICQICGYHEECYTSDETGVDYQFGGAICTARENCGNGSPIEDASVDCPDMIAPADQAMVDAATLDAPTADDAIVDSSTADAVASTVDLEGYSDVGGPCGGFTTMPKHCLPGLTCAPNPLPDAPGTCTGACHANGGACGSNADCCSNNCILRTGTGYCCMQGGCP